MNDHRDKMNMKECKVHDGAMCVCNDTTERIQPPSQAQNSQKNSTATHMHMLSNDNIERWDVYLAFSPSMLFVIVRRRNGKRGIGDIVLLSFLRRMLDG